MLKLLRYSRGEAGRGEGGGQGAAALSEVGWEEWLPFLLTAGSQMKSILHGMQRKTEEKGKRKTRALDKGEFKTPDLSVRIIWWNPVHRVL